MAKNMTAKLRPPREPHGRRLLIPQIDRIAQEQPERPWISVPVNDEDLTEGFKDITFGQFANAVNTAAIWLRENLGLPSTDFPAFAYTSLPDYSYALLGAAAGKLGYQMILFGPTISAEGQRRILEAKNCTVYLCTKDQSSFVQQVEQLQPGLRIVCAPGLQTFMTEKPPAEQVQYMKSFEEADNDPWLIFHTSGTTGFPKPVTTSQKMMSMVDVTMGLDDIGDTVINQSVDSRMYLPMRPSHYVSMVMTLSGTIWAGVVPVYGPGGKPPLPQLVKGVLQYSNITGALLVPAQLDALCQDPEALELLRQLKYIHYAGAPLSTSSGELLSRYTRVVPAIGSTDAGGYFTSLPNTTEDWDYVSFQPHAGVVMEHRVDDRYELVFIRDPQCWVQPVFHGRPELDRFETQDLWVEHPVKKGQWKIVGRLDDMLSLSDGYAMYVATLESAVAEHPLVKHALVGGNGKPRPILLIEPVDGFSEQTKTQQGREELLDTLWPHLEKVGLKLHPRHAPARLDPRLVLFLKGEKPWPRTLKDTPIRVQTMKLYEPEIEEAYSAAKES